jgi:cyclic pyranopterin phosphate synthase
MGTYLFDEVDAELRLPPVAVRRALDLAGQALAPEGWDSLSPADRATLVAVGAAPTIDVDAIRDVLSRANPGATKVTAGSDPDRVTLPPSLREALGGRVLTDTTWTNLRALDRYALCEAIRRGSRAFQSAYEEILRAPLTHLDPRGEVHMVGVAAKAVTLRRAVAGARVCMRRETLTRLEAGNTPKGDVLASARIAGIQAAKRTWELIPLCHQVALCGAEVHIELDGSDSERGFADVRATVEAIDRTGVEMEALVAATTAALTLYDMLKAVDRWMTITDVGLLEKSGGRSGQLARGAS